MEKVSIKGAHPYDILIREGLLDECGKVFRKQNIKGKLGIVSEDTVAPLYLKKITESLQAAEYEVYSIVLPAGEKTKNIMSLQQILSFLANAEFDRGDTLVALGGGVIGDLTGMSAGVYLRGISYVQMPTTLLAAVDSSVGGKTAIDLPEGKNLAGLFWHPDLVITDPACFRTLTEEVWRQGMAEVIKTAILSGEALFSLCESGVTRQDMRKVEQMIRGCVSYKADIVEKDFTEQGVRKLLNLGHTPAHSIEKRSGYTVSHGDAVARGLFLMTAGACKRGGLSEEEARRIFCLLRKEKFPETLGFSAKELADDARYDKKRKGDRITLIIPEGIGRCEAISYPLSELENFYEEAVRYWNEC